MILGIVLSVTILPSLLGESPPPGYTLKGVYYVRFDWFRLMPCYHPLKAFHIGFHDSGKPKYQITSYNVDHLILDGSSWRPIFSPTLSEGLGINRDWIEIPCGKCIGCRLKYSSDWATRCMLESQDHERNCFITLTYNDDNLPIPRPEAFDSETGELDRYPLEKRDLQLFFKRLRKHLDKQDIKIRYFACGEYGESTHRPHYHIILFGYDFAEDRILHSKSPQGFNYYISQTLTDIWSKGHTLVTDVSWNTCAYTARYVLKKITGKNKPTSYPSEFTVMSRKPGIARNYFDENYKNIYSDIESQEIFLSLPEGAKKVRPARYYDKLYDSIEPDNYEKIKAIRKDKALQSKIFKMKLTDKSYLDILRDSEDFKLSQTKILNESRKKVD